ncbi:MAG: hypothetical protein KI785_13665 [Devosiaceae bacterium]|nr:hypothetical protein [Devosiaceae bacterium MH13]
MMRKRIQRQILKMSVVLGGTLLLVAWRHEFVWDGLTSNIYLNSVIITLFLFGMFLAFSSAMRLKHEEVAFVALQEAHDDIRFEEERSKTAPFWRHYRCLEPGIPFAKPRLLSHVFDLTYEKMMRTREITISIGTMQSLVSEFKVKLNEDRAMLTYITGILVFLGLIGTFIGLMDMVRSVGGIIGSIANMDMSDPTAAFTKLINDLQAPLVGMATGFSSSLFGLFGSLILGLQGRFLSEATGVLRSGLETWLSSIADLDGDRDEAEEEHREAVLDLLDAQQEQLAGLQKSIQQLTQVSAQSALAQRDGLEVLRSIADNQVVQTDVMQAGSARTSLSDRLGTPSPARGSTFDEKALQTLNENLEKAMAGGMTDMSQAIETSFIGYAQLLRQSMAMHNKRAATGDEPSLDARIEGTNG